MTSFFELLFNGNVGDIRRHVEAYPESLHDLGPGGQTALWFAVKTSREPVVRLLLQLGADPQQEVQYCASMRGKRRPEPSATPLSQASDSAMIATLVEYGARLDSIDGAGKSVLHHLARSGNPELVSTALRLGGRFAIAEVPQAVERFQRRLRLLRDKQRLSLPQQRTVRCLQELLQIMSALPADQSQALYPDIKLLPGSTAIRRRPSQYVGPLDDPLLANNLLIEALCCARDEALQGRCERAEIRLLDDHIATVQDWGPGLPMTRDADGRPLAEVWLTQLHACAEAKAKTVAESTCLNGLAVLNALCRKLEVRILQQGTIWAQSYQQGTRIAPFARVGTTESTGTCFHIELDRELLPGCRFNLSALRAWADAEVCRLSLDFLDLRG